MATRQYVLNYLTLKLHKSGCRYAKNISPEMRGEMDLMRAREAFQQNGEIAFCLQCIGHMLPGLDTIADDIEQVAFEIEGTIGQLTDALNELEATGLPLEGELKTAFDRLKSYTTHTEHGWATSSAKTLSEALYEMDDDMETATDLKTIRRRMS